MPIPQRPRPTRVVVFIDGQNLYYRCQEHFGHHWAHPLRLAEALVEDDRTRYGRDSHVLSGVRYYTGIHDPNRRSHLHTEMERRLTAYRAAGVETFATPLRYDSAGRAREKGVDSRITLDLMRLGWKGLFDVAIIVSEDSDLDEAAKDVYELRDHERWVAVENALPWSPSGSTARPPRWLASVRRRRRITQAMFSAIRDDTNYRTP